MYYAINYSQLEDRTRSELKGFTLGNILWEFAHFSFRYPNFHNFLD